MTENALFLLPALRRARDLIDRDYAEPLDLEAMAGEAGYSRFHFARAFTAAYGETPRTYLTRRRIERAKTLLRTANLSVTEICFLVGFASLGSFRARFRALVGRPPSEYRDDAAAPGRRAIGEKHGTPRPGYGAQEPQPKEHNDQPPQSRERVRARPGPGKGVLHRDPRVRAS